jgi:hypothetical protein
MSRVATSTVLLALCLVQDPHTLAPYFSTPPDVVERMLALAGVTSEDVVYDLG